MKKIIWVLIALVCSFGLAFGAYTLNSSNSTISMRPAVAKKDQVQGVPVKPVLQQQAPGGVSPDAIKKLKLN